MLSAHSFSVTASEVEVEEVAKCMELSNSRKKNNVCLTLYLLSFVKD